MDIATRATSPDRLADLLGRVQRKNHRILASATTLTASDDIVLVDTTGGSVTITLPDARQHANHIFHVKKMIAANTCTVQRSGSDTIDGATTSAWTTRYEARSFASVIVTAPATWGYIVI